MIEKGFIQVEDDNEGFKTIILDTSRGKYYL